MVCYAEKQVKPFWSSSLGQMVQFDTIIFWSVRVDQKSHYNSRVSLHEAPTKNAGLSYQKIADELGLKAKSTAQSVYKRYIRNNSYLPKK